MSGAPTEMMLNEEPQKTACEASRAYEDAIDTTPDERDPNSLVLDESAPSPDASSPQEPSPRDTAPDSSAPDGPALNVPAPSPHIEPAPDIPAPHPAQPDITSAPYMHPGGPLRLRMKIWTDPQTRRRYLMPLGFFRDIRQGHPVTHVMYAYAMCDDDTKLVTLTAAEWNALPFFYFREDGWAPRAGERPADMVK